MIDMEDLELSSLLKYNVFPNHFTVNVAYVVSMGSHNSEVVRKMKRRIVLAIRCLYNSLNTSTISA